MKYEVFCDVAYFDQWAVRPVGESRWGHCYHLPSKEEAEGLAKQLEELESERDEGLKALQHIAYSGLSSRNLEFYARKFIVKQKGVAK